MSRPPKPLIDRTKLARVLGMLGSAHAGERDAAALAAEKLRREAGLTWEQVLSCTAPMRPVSDHFSPSPLRPATPEEPRYFAMAIGFCLEFARTAGFTDWEIRFLHKLNSWTGAISERQQETLRELHSRARAAEERVIRAARRRAAA
jgi:hypothetical protein